MLREVKKLQGMTIRALDGEVGHIDELLFDDVRWIVRYLIVDTESWLYGRKVLISPIAFGTLDEDQRTLEVKLTREQIKKSPGVETDLPVSRQWERQYYDYFAWPYYWDGGSGWGAYWYPGGLLAQGITDTETRQQQAEEWAREHADAHLRSTKEVTGYGISATDTELGHVEDFLVNDETWRISYLAVDTLSWWPGKKVLLPMDWVGQVDWPSRRVHVKVSGDEVRHAPVWDSGIPLTEEKKTFVAVYETHQEAELAIRALQKQGFDMTKLSIVGQDFHTEEEVVGYYTAGDQMKAWGTAGAFWGGIWSLLFGSAFFVVPGVGPLLVAGPVVAWIVGALESAVVVGGVSALGAALLSIGVPNDSIIAYEKQLKAGKFVVIAHDSQSAVDKAMIALETLQQTHPKL